MALKLKFKSKDEVPAEQQGLYVEREASGCSTWMAGRWRRRNTMSSVPSMLLSARSWRSRRSGLRASNGRGAKLAEEKRRLEEEQQLKAGEVEKVYENRFKTARPIGKSSCPLDGRVECRDGATYPHPD